VPSQFDCCLKKVYDARDIEGARESGRRQTAANRAVKTMELEAQPIEPFPIKMRIAADQEPVAIPGRRERRQRGALTIDTDIAARPLERAAVIASGLAPMGRRAASPIWPLISGRSSRALLIISLESHAPLGHMAFTARHCLPARVIRSRLGPPKTGEEH
jgi:hypothetical protein